MHSDSPGVRKKLLLSPHRLIADDEAKAPPVPAISRKLLSIGSNVDKKEAYRRRYAVVVDVTNRACEDETEIDSPQWHPYDAACLPDRRRYRRNLETVVETGYYE